MTHTFVARQGQGPSIVIIAVGLLKLFLLLFFQKVALSGTLYFVGLLIGSLIGGYPADYFGRKPVLFFFVFIGGFSTLIGGLVSTFPVYTFFRLLAGIGEQGLTQLTCTMSVEIVGSRYQALVGNLNQIFFALGTGVVRFCNVDSASIKLANSNFSRQAYLLI